MRAKQLYLILLSSLALLFLAFVGVAYGANKILAGQASKLSTLRADSEVLSSTQTQLTKNKQDIIKYGELNEIAQSVVPQDKDQAEAVRQIVNLAAQSGIPKLSSIVFPTSTLGTGVSGKTVGNPNLTQLTPVPGISGVYQLQITVTQDNANLVNYSQFTTFLKKLEQNRRTAQVSSITVQPDAQNPSKVAFTLVINEFIKP